MAVTKKKAKKVDPRTGRPDDRKGKDPRGGPADDIPRSQYRRPRRKKKA